MQHYRIYSMDRVGHIAFAQDMECADDRDALRQGKEHAEPYGVEVWRGSRLVGRIAPVQAVSPW